MCIKVQEFKSVRASGDLFETALSGLRSMVHRICKLTKAHEDCPYLKKYGFDYPLTCDTCPLREQGESDGT